MASAEAIQPLETRDGTRIIVHVFPLERRFAGDVRRALLAVGASDRTEPELRDTMTAALRAWYPRIAIHRREELATIGPGECVWYVFRDGKIAKPNATIDRLHRVLADARSTKETAHKAMEHAQESMELASRPRRTSRTRVASRVDPDANGDE